MLQKRVRDADANVAAFRAGSGPLIEQVRGQGALGVGLGAELVGAGVTRRVEVDDEGATAAARADRGEVDDGVSGGGSCAGPLVPPRRRFATDGGGFVAAAVRMAGAATSLHRIPTRRLTVMTPRQTTKTARTAAIALAMLAALPGCAFLAVQTAPAKAPAATRTELAGMADALFWDTLHNGRYDGIGRALEVQTAAYLENPNDAVTAARAGWLHVWRLSESARLGSPPATITNDATMARKYFEEAARLAPGEARYAGFLGAVRLSEGTIHHDEKLVRQGYYTLRDAIDAWPEFNLFTAGYMLSRLPADTPRYREALEWQWRTLDLCAGGPVDRANPDYSGVMSRATTVGEKRACWNSTIAPYNFEGFFMNMGDMLVKAGDPATARKVYATARLSPSYAGWPYRAVLEQRMVDADANVAGFKAGTGTAMMGQSAYSCMACHQAR